ncbi:hypothetical protein BpHYR1_018966 [Brachionus plicatilis]|uniref:Uncharacterized protein n=1 Tax=Brachionus plicatilis TaxID=10195 RepID=A0A3M7QMQ4_BRAPC|nr:hypothetical protein BpHYR1_018966 [Brachionus plicatilis]
MTHFTGFLFISLKQNQLTKTIQEYKYKYITKPINDKVFHISDKQTLAWNRKKIANGDDTEFTIDQNTIS